MSSPTTTVSETVATEGGPATSRPSRLRAPRRGRPPGRRFPTHIVVFLAPAVVTYSVFMVYPLLDSLRLSLFDDGGSFVGLDNFDTLFNDPLWADQFWNALGNNFVFFAFHLLVQNPVGLLLAALLTAPGIRGQNIYRTAIFIPTTLSVVIVGFIWRQILSPLWGIIDTPLLGESGTVLPTLSLMSVWQFVGIPMIFFYAVLIAIPKDLIEAARVDGASSWKIFWKITFPLILADARHHHHRDLRGQLQRLRPHLHGQGRPGRSRLRGRHHGHDVLPQLLRQPAAGR